VESFLEGLILGAVQGVTEWLPISSEAVNTLILLNFFQKSTGEAIRLAIWFHTGTLVSSLIYFRHDVLKMIRLLPGYVRRPASGGTTEYNSLITFMIVSTLFTVAIGTPLLLFGLAQEAFLPAGWVMAGIGFLLIITGLVQRLALRSTGTKTITGIKDAILLGVVQAFSALPGLSRSGLTVSALVLRGYKPEQAVRLSFLMSIPVVLAAGLGLNLIGGISFELASLSGVIAAFVLGILTIGIMMRIASRIRFWKFCFFLGALSFLPLIIELLS
jgi:undecaprenyl-diphosphatase